MINLKSVTFFESSGLTNAFTRTSQTFVPQSRTLMCFLSTDRMIKKTICSVGIGDPWFKEAFRRCLEIDDSKRFSTNHGNWRSEKIFETTYRKTIFPTRHFWTKLGSFFEITNASLTQIFPRTIMLLNDVRNHRSEEDFHMMIEATVIAEFWWFFHFPLACFYFPPQCILRQENHHPSMLTWLPTLCYLAHSSNVCLS